MSPQKSAAPPVPDDGTPPVPQPSFVERFFQPRRLAFLALLLSLPVLAPWALRQLPDLRSRSEYRLAFRQIALDPPPSGPVPADVLEQVRQQSQLPEELSLLDPELPRRLAEAFQAHPWIAQVHEVRNRYPAVLSVKVTYRRPAALIQIDGGRYAVDPQGVLLPPGDFSQADAQRYVTVVGVRSKPRGGAGAPWGDPVVVGAAQLADFLGPRWKELQIAAVVAPSASSPAADQLFYELETQGGSRILWGRSPQSRYPGELAAGQKLGRLEKYLAEFGSFDEPHGPYEIDIRHWQEMTRRPLTAAKQQAAKPRSPSRRR